MILFKQLPYELNSKIYMYSRPFMSEELKLSIKLYILIIKVKKAQIKLASLPLTD